MPTAEAEADGAVDVSTLNGVDFAAVYTKTAPLTTREATAA